MPPPPVEQQQKPNFHPAWIWKILVLVLFLFILAVVILATLPIVNRGRPSYTEGEIHAIAAALENYKADHGNFPSDPQTTEQLAPSSASDPESYIPSSELLYNALSGRSDPNDKIVYYPFSPKDLKTDRQGHTYIVDEWGNSIGYSTMGAVHPKSHGGYNFTFDLWSTGGGKKDSDRAKWIINWQDSGANTGQ